MKTSVLFILSLSLLSTSLYAHNPDTKTDKAASARTINTDKPQADITATLNNEDPVSLLNSSIVKTQNLLIQNSKQLSDHPKKLLKLIKENVSPLLANNIIAQLLIGKERWRSAPKTELQKFINELTQMLVCSYAANVAQAGHYKIEIYKFANDSWKAKRIIVVRGTITNLNKPNSNSSININMLKEKSGQWKIYDLSVAGVSILDNYKAQFKDYKTLKDINNALEKKNAQLSDQNK